MCIRADSYVIDKLALRNSRSYLVYLLSYFFSFLSRRIRDLFFTNCTLTLFIV